MTYGATPSDWTHFDLVLGLTRDLLPVVSNPHAEISPDSRMKAVGKTPSRYNREREVVGFPQWTQFDALPHDIETWSAERDYGICVQTRHVRGLDIDVDDDAALDIETAFLNAIGGLELPVRCRSNSQKMLLAFVVEGNLPKRRFLTETGAVEFLATGQQFVAIGTHTSGVRYNWPDGLPTSFPVISADAFDAAWRVLEERFAVEKVRDTDYAQRRRGADLAIEDPVCDHLYAQNLVLDEGRDGALYVECPWKGDHTSDSGVTETAWYPAGSNGYERGHFKCLHAHCAGRTDSEFKRAVGFDETGFEPIVDHRPQPNPAALARAWTFRDPRTIPPRKWLYGRHYIRQFVSTTVAPGGSGKSALALLEAMAIATGRDLLGVQPVERGRVWYFNGEDPLEETERRIAAACLHYGIAAYELEGWLFIGSGRDTDLILARQNREGVLLADPMVEQVAGLIRENDIALAIIDPFVSSHRVTENDNGAIDTVAKAWGRIADQTGCAVELVHHVRKGSAGVATTVEDGRGASALLAAARSARVINGMTQAEADKVKVSNRGAYFRVTNGKANLAPTADASDWFRFQSVNLMNGEELGEGDSVGVVTTWTWPEDVSEASGEPAFDFTLDDVRAVQTALRNDPSRGIKDLRSEDCFTKLIIETLHLERSERAVKCVEAAIKTWVDAQYFTRSIVVTRHRKARDGYEVGIAPDD